MKEENIDWWKEEYGFFGEHYLKGDDSQEGYLINRRQSLKDRTETEVSGIIHLLHLSKGSRILDLPCGYGRHSIGLASKGYKVVGMDINTVHLNKAQEDAHKSHVIVDFQKKNMFDLDEFESFDAVINMFYSFGFFETDNENFKVLKNFYRALKKGGSLLFHTDVNIPRILSGQYREKEIRTLAAGEKLTIIDKYDSNTKRINGLWHIQHADGTEDEKHYSVRVYDKEEFFKYCYDAGFTKCRAYGDWDGSPYSSESEDMIVVAEK